MNPRNNLIKYIAIPLVIVALSIGGYFVFFRPPQETAPRETPTPTPTAPTPTPTIPPSPTPTPTLTPRETTPITTPTTPATPTPTYSPPPGLSGIKITGAGATFQAPQIEEWARRFREITGVEISYQSVGSGAGQRMFLRDKTVDFGASDPPLARRNWTEHQGRVLQVPWIMGAVVVVYNIPELRDVNLNFTAEVIAKIYKGEIEYWNDPLIARLNPRVAGKLPRQRITAVHRTDSSGTTEIFTVFLHKATPETWPRELVGKSINWPVDATGRGIGAKGNEGVTATVVNTPYSIGYVEFSYAIEHKLPVGAVRNAAGRFILPSPGTIMNAARGVNIPRSPLDDFSETFEVIIYSPHEDAYPLSSLAFALFWKEYTDPNVAKAISEFLKWIALEGYKYMVTGYVRPPPEVTELLLEAARLISGGQ